MGGDSGPECSNCVHDLLVQEVRVAERKEEVHGSENSFHKIVASYLNGGIAHHLSQPQTTAKTSYSPSRSNNVSGNRRVEI